MNRTTRMKSSPPSTLLTLVRCWLCLITAASLVAAEAKKGLYENDFESYRQGNWPADWVTAGGKWSIVADGSLAVQQSSTELSESAYAALTWLNYTARANACCLDHGTQWGMGIVGYWQDNSNYYRLSNFGNRLHILKVRGGGPEELAAVDVTMGKGQWYTFVLSFQNGPTGVLLRSKVFPVSQAEPERWLLQAVDLSPIRPDGAAGLWAAKARCHFDQFSIAPTATPPARQVEPTYRRDFSLDAAGPLPDDWFAVRGDWRIVREGKSALEQSATSPSLDFNGNAFSLLANWHNYTVQASLKVTGKGKTWGQGIIGYWQNEDDHYRLMGIDDTLYLARRFRGNLVHLKSVPYKFDRATAYHFKLKLQSTKEKTLLYGKTWPTTEKEPEAWALEAEDSSIEHFVAGSVGFWSLKGTYTFDDLKVVTNE